MDGIEIVASLVLLADRRCGRRSGWLPWAALAAGTTASLAANVAAADTGPAGRVIASWPAFALLVAVKLLSGMLEHRRGLDRPPGIQDPPADRHDRPVVVIPGGGGDDHGTPPGPMSGRGVPAASATAGTAGLAGTRAVPHPVPGNGLTSHLGAGTGTPPGRGPGTEPGDGKRPITAASAGRGTGRGTEPDIAALLPAARAARDRVLGRGSVLTRDTLAAQLRRDGHPVRNARVSQLLTALRYQSQAVYAGQEQPGPGADQPVLDAAR